MAANATNTLQATIISADANGVISINRGFGNPALAGNTADLTINQVLVNGDNAIVAFAGTYFQLYVKNNSAIGSGLNLTVKYTPTGGVQQLSPLITPGSVFVIWGVANNVVGAGFGSLVFNASAANLIVEYFLGT